MKDCLSRDKPLQIIRLLLFGLSISSAMVCAHRPHLPPCEQGVCFSHLNIACNSGIYLMALAGFHLLEGVGKSWYCFNLQGVQQSVFTSSSRSAQGESIQSKREITSKDSEAQIVRSEAPSELLRELVAHLGKTERNARGMVVRIRRRAC